MNEVQKKELAATLAYQLGKTHGYLKRSEVQKLYEERKGHGLGTAHPSPEIRDEVRDEFQSDFDAGFADGVKQYEATLS